MIKCLILFYFISILNLYSKDYESNVRCVNPADNISKSEILPKLTVLNDDLRVSINTITLKYDKAIKGIYGFNIEVPIARFNGYRLSENGISDILVKGRVQTKFGNFVTIAGLESVLPTATNDLLGAGTLQLNPALSLVYSYSPQFFVVRV